VRRVREQYEGGGRKRLWICSKRGLHPSGKLVRESKNFVDPTSKAHTQKIESSWRALKLRISRGGVNVKNDFAGLHFAEFLWFKQYNENAFDNFVKHISDIY